jgi:hypothetical protein
MHNRTPNHRVLGVALAGLLTLTARPRLVAVLTAGALLAVTAPTAALAAERPARERPRTEATERHADPETARQRCMGALDKRLTDLGNAATRLAAVPHVTDAHQAALSAILDETVAGLEALIPDINAAADTAALRTACRSMFEDFRVYALVLPRTRLVVAADVAVAGAGKLDRVAARLESAIERGAAGGQGTAEAEAKLAEMRDEIDSARDAAAGVPAGIMGLTAADWNDDHEVLTPAREALRSARTDLRDARRLAGEIKAALAV